MLSILQQRTNKERLDVLEAKIEESEKADSHWESNPGHLVCAISVLPLSYDTRATTSTHNPLAQVVLKCLSLTPGRHSVCAIRIPFGVDRKIFSIREPILSGFLNLNV